METTTNKIYTFESTVSIKGLEIKDGKTFVRGRLISINEKRKVRKFKDRAFPAYQYPDEIKLLKDLRPFLFYDEAPGTIPYAPILIEIGPSALIYKCKDIKRVDAVKYMTKLLKERSDSSYNFIFRLYLGMREDKTFKAEAELIGIKV